MCVCVCVQCIYQDAVQWPPPLMPPWLEKQAKVPSRVVTTRGSALLAALYTCKNDWVTSRVPLTINDDDVPSRTRKFDNVP